MNTIHLKAKTLFFTCLFSFLIIQSFSLKAQNLKAGDIHPDCKFIEAEKLDDFKDGFAYVYKGQVGSFINRKGDFLFPYGKYRVKLWNYFDLSPFFVANRCPVWNEKGQAKYIDTTGVEKENTLFTSFLKENKEKGTYLCSNNRATGDTLRKIVFQDGKYIAKPIKSAYEVLRESFLVSDTIPFMRGDKVGFLTISGQVLIKEQFANASFFSEGLAVVQKYDLTSSSPSFGFIDGKGIVVIDYLFSKRPRNFSEGLSLVQTSDPAKMGFYAAYIDRNGEVKIKINPLKDERGYTPYENELTVYNNGIDFKNGFAVFPVGSKNLRNQLKNTVDKSGNVYTLPRYLKDEYYLKELKEQNQYSKPIPPQLSFRGNGGESSSEPIFSNNLAIIYNFKNGKEGVSNQKCEVVIDVVFDKIKNFDEVSGLAYAKYTVPETKEIREGYINTQGVFVILKKDKKSGW